jgi:hypothetical protein
MMRNRLLGKVTHSKAKPHKPKRKEVRTMRTMEIYFRDLNDEAKERFTEIFGLPEDMNLDVFPLAVVDMADLEDQEEES